METNDDDVNAFDAFVRDYSMWIIPLAVAVIHAYTFGPVLTYGSLVDGVQLNFTTARYDAVKVGDFQYGAFIVSGILLKLWNLMIQSCPCNVDITNPWVYRAHTFCFLILWALGMFLPPYIGTNDYTLFVVTYVVLGGLGSGFLFWHTLTALRSWFKETDMAVDNEWVQIKAFNVAFLVVSLAPAVYQAMYASVYTLNDHLFNMKWPLAVVGTIAIFVFGAMITIHRTKEEDKEEEPVEVDLKEEARVVEEMWRGHFPVYLAAGVYQFAFYAPFIMLPQFMTYLGGSSADGRETLSILGAGAVAGKLMASFVDYWNTKVGVTAAYMLLSVVPFAVWSAPDLNIQGLKAIAFFVGMVPAAVTQGVFLHLLGTHDETNTRTLVEDFQTKIAMFCVCLSGGAFSSALLAERVQVNYVGATYNGFGMVGGVLAMFAGAGCFVLMTSLVFCGFGGEEHFEEVPNDDDDDEAATSFKSEGVVVVELSGNDKHMARRHVSTSGKW